MPNSAALYDDTLGHCGGRRIVATSPIRSLDMMVALYESPPYDIRVAAMHVARLSVNLAAAPVFGGCGTDRGIHYGGRRRSLFYTPAGCDAFWVKRQPSRHLNIFLRDGLVEELTDGRSAMLRPDRPLADLNVPAIRPWIEALERAITCGRRGPLVDDVSLGLAHLIVAELACTSPRPQPALAPAALARVKDYVAAHVGETVRVAELAALAGLPVARFTRCFHAAMGCTPHRFILTARVEQAVSLLRRSAMPMCAVAAECGFSSQQHMATVIRQLTGATPSSFCRDRCSGSRT